MDTEDLLSEALTPLGFVVRVTRQRWELVTTGSTPSWPDATAS